MAITIEPLGGLGNQLFTYALGRALSIDLGVPLIADLWNFVGYDWHNYELNSFKNKITYTYNSLSYVDRLNISSRQKRLSHRFHKKIAPFQSKFYCKEKSSTFDSRFLSIQDGTRLRGYFQSEKYFSRHANLIKQEIMNLQFESTWFIETKKKLQSYGDWIGVHVRRGNYKNLPLMGLVNDRYYKDSLKLVKQINGKDDKIIVFSDNIDEVKEIFSEHPKENLVFIDPPKDSNSLESLLLMAMSSHLITANSSYSWWAAWLGSKKNRTVICPRPWLNDHNFNERDLLPHPWLTLSRE